MRINSNIALVFNLSLLIIVLFVSNFSLAQNPQTGQINNSGLTSPVNYTAKDSIVADIPANIVRLYGEANVKYEDVDLSASLIEINIKTNEVTATYTNDSLGNPIGKPVFTGEGQTSECDYLKYNFETKKGFIKEVRMQQGEGYIHMAESKVHPNEEIHFKNGKFTTCDKEEPHFHFALSRAIVIPDKRIVTGPVYMRLFNIPTPLAAPFGFFPNSETKKAGLILPEFQNSNRYGFGLENLGYYFPLGDYWETYLYSSIYTTGSWAGQNITNYSKKYKYVGNFGVRFEQFRGKFYDDTETINKWTVDWKHNQDPKAHPSLKFSTDIRFVSDNTAKTSLEAINPNFYNNTFNSSINVSKIWKLRKFNGTMGLQSSLQQNSLTKNYSIELPRYNISVSRFDLGVFRKEKIGSKWYEKISVTYNMNARNFIQAPDSIFNFNAINLVPSYAKNGIEHQTVIQSNLRVLGGRFVFTPSANYREFWDFQSQNRAWNPITEKVDTTEVKGFRTGRDMSFAGNVSFNFFGYYKFKGKSAVKFRHVASPTLNFTYRPDLSQFQEIQIDTEGKTTFYSPFEQSLYRDGARGASGRLNFGVNNTLEMKKREKKDTINETMKSFKLIDAFSASSGYDFMKDSLQLGNFALALRTSRFLNVFSFQSSASLSPYSWVDSTGVGINEYAWNDGKGIGRIQNAQGVLNASFNNQTGRAKQEKSKESAQPGPDGQVKEPYSVPWNLNLSYNIDYSRFSKTNVFNATIDTFRVIQTVRADGNINLNEKWKIDYAVNYDIQTLLVTNYTIGLWRDLHCWETRLFYQQLNRWNPEDGGPSNWSIMLHIGVKASMFQDIKYDHTFTNPF